MKDTSTERRVSITLTEEALIAMAELKVKADYGSNAELSNPSFEIDEL